MNILQRLVTGSALEVMPKFLVVSCDDSAAWSPVSFADMFSSSLSVEGDEWTEVNVARGDPLPEARDFKGIVLTGSRFNVRDQLPWFEDLAGIVRIAARDGNIKIYGGCFGCQFVCYALGGKVDRNPDGRFVLKNETVTVDQHLFSRYCCSCVDGGCACCGTPQFQLIESHGDCICELPPESCAIASSPTCRYEMFVAGARKNILCCQAHPEFDLQYCVHERIFPAVCRSKRLNEAEQSESIESLKSFTHDDSKRMMNIISRFLHS